MQEVISFQDRPQLDYPQPDEVGLMTRLGVLTSIEAVEAMSRIRRNGGGSARGKRGH